MREIWNIPNYLPHLQHEVHRTDRQVIQHPLPRAPAQLQKWIWQIQHLLENRQAIGSMNDITDTLYFTNKE